MGLYVQAEYRTSNGRIDILIGTNDYVYIIELKFNATAQEAMEQIENYYGEDSEEWEELELEMHSHDHAGEKIICTCFNVTENQIWEAIKINNLTTLEDVTNYTKAGGACGQCHVAIQKIIDEVKNKTEKIRE